MENRQGWYFVHCMLNAGTINREPAERACHSLKSLRTLMKARFSTLHSLIYLFSMRFTSSRIPITEQIFKAVGSHQVQYKAGIPDSD